MEMSISLSIKSGGFALAIPTTRLASIDFACFQPPDGHMLIWAERSTYFVVISVIDAQKVIEAGDVLAGGMFIFDLFISTHSKSSHIGQRRSLSHPAAQLEGR